MRDRFVTASMLLALLASFSPAGADPSDLSNGVFITHYEPEIQYSDGTTNGWCQDYLDNYAIHNCQDQNPRIVSEGQGVVWFILSAWEETKTFCGCEFGFDDYNPNLFVFVEWGGCPPTTDYLEIPTSGWPGPGEGTAIAAISEGFWEGDFVPVYWFAGYAYDQGRIPVGLMPLTSNAGWANCVFPYAPYPATCLGQLGINTSGEACCWGSTPAAIETWGSLKEKYR